MIYFSPIIRDLVAFQDRMDGAKNVIPTISPTPGFYQNIAIIPSAGRPPLRHLVVRTEAQFTRIHAHIHAHDL
jgi:hypothetical protein